MSDYFDRIERQLQRSVEAGAPRRVWPELRWSPARVLAPAAAVIVALVVVVAFAATRGGTTGPAPAAPAGSRVEFTAAPASAASRLPGVAADILTRRLAEALPAARVLRTGDTITVSLPGLTPAQRQRVLTLGAPGVLHMYDWEASVLTSNGKTVASRLGARDSAALDLSQGTGGAPGGADSGAMPLYDAVRLAARQPTAARGGSRTRFLFGAPGSTACSTAAVDRGQPPAAGADCLLSGPAPTLAELRAGLPRGVSPSAGRLLTVPGGTTVVEATGGPGSWSDPTARFYVLRGAPRLTGAMITDPRATEVLGGAPDVRFGLNAVGREAFHRVTAAIARRGMAVSDPGMRLNQHFAITLDDRLITVPSIDFTAYPDGLVGKLGADIAGGPTRQAARDLAALLRYGPLPAGLVAR